jgi:ectoine hydroxylase-related dioxygenase (phytanoyl-CoA dioxygenase family)
MGVKSVRLYHDQALFKPPGGEKTYWHQDMFYWPLDTDKTITMWMPLVDVSEEMGTMIFACGSHKEGLMSDAPISREGGSDVEKLIAGRGYACRSHVLKAGDATFHSGYIAHSAYPNVSKAVREVITIIYFADGASLLVKPSTYQKVDAEVFVPGGLPGQPAVSPLNPLLYSSEASRTRKLD